MPGTCSVACTPSTAKKAMPNTVFICGMFEVVDIDMLHHLNRARVTAGPDGEVIAGVLSGVSLVPMYLRVQLANSMTQVDRVVPDCPAEPPDEFFHMLGVTHIVTTEDYSSDDEGASSSSSS